MKRIWVLFLFLVPMLVAQATEPESPKGKREINFEGELVEGAARQSMDSLTQTAHSSSKSKPRLYEKREKVQERNSERVREIIETY